MKRTILVKSFFVELLRNWLKYGLAWLLITAVIAGLGLALRQDKVTPDSPQVLALKSQIESAENLINDYQAYLRDSIVASYNPLSLPTFNLVVSPQYKDAEVFNRLIGQISSLHGNDSIYNQARALLGTDATNQFIDELITVTYDEKARVIRIQTFFEEPQKAEALARLINENIVQTLKAGGLSDLTMSEVSGVFTSLENVSLRDKVARYKAEIDKNQNQITANLTKIEQLNPSKPAPNFPRDLIRRGIFGALVATMAILAWLAVKVTSNKATLMAADLRETYLLPVLFGVKDGGSAIKFEPSETKYLPLEQAIDYLTNLVQVYSDEPVLVVSTTPTELRYALSKQSPQLIDGGVLFENDNLKLLKQHQQIVLMTDPYMVTHQEFQESLQVLAQMKKEIIGVVIV